MKKNNTKLEKEEYEPKIPNDLHRIIISTSSTKKIWKSLTPIARRDFISWIESAKQSKTRKHRINRVPSMLAEGKRRPCCYTIVPMNVYRALSDVPRAKAQWNNLTPTERRDFVDWIESPEESDTRKNRIKKTCELLSNGKRHP